MTTPRPDQRMVPGHASGSGSLSGAGDLAGALGYPGVPPAVPNCQGKSIIQQNVGLNTLFTFPAAGRLWLVVLTYVITPNPSFSKATVRTYAQVVTNPGGLTLAIVQLGTNGTLAPASGTCTPPVAAFPVVAGTSLTLDVNGGNVVTNLDQQASASVLYSVP